MPAARSSRIARGARDVDVARCVRAHRPLPARSLLFGRRAFEASPFFFFSFASTVERERRSSDADGSRPPPPRDPPPPSPFPGVGSAGSASTAAPAVWLRREPFDFGLLPASCLLPRVETAAGLAPIQRRLLAAASPSPSDPARLVVTPEVAARCVGIPASSAPHVFAVLASVVPAEEPHPTSELRVEPEPERDPTRSTPARCVVEVRELLLFLFAQTFSRPRAQSQLRESPGGGPLEADAFALEAGYLGQGGGPDSPTRERGSPGSPARGRPPGSAGSRAGFGSPERPAALGASPSGSPGKVPGSDANEWATEALQRQFVLRHFDAVCGLLSDDVDGAPGEKDDDAKNKNAETLGTREADALAFFFDVDDDDRLSLNPGSPGFGFAARTGLFRRDGDRVSRASLRDWIVGGLERGDAVERSHSSGESPRGGASSSGSGARSRSVVRVSGVHKGTAVRRERDAPRGSSAKVDRCVDAVVYLLAPFERATIARCSGCVVVIGACARALKVERCERVTIIAASRRVQARNVHECAFHLGVAEPPLFVGDCRGNFVAPYSTFYESLERHLAIAGVSPRSAAWNRPALVEVLSGTPEPTTGEASADGGFRAAFETDPGRLRGRVDALPASEFSPFIVPFREDEEESYECDEGGRDEGGRDEGGGGSNAPEASNASGEALDTRSRTRPPPTQANPFATPPEYVRALDEKVRSVASLRAALRDAGLDEGVKRELQATIQAHFKEWLLQSGSMRQVYDLARIERGE